MTKYDAKISILTEVTGIKIKTDLTQICQVPLKNLETVASIEYREKISFGETDQQLKIKVSRIKTECGSRTLLAEFSRSSNSNKITTNYSMEGCTSDEVKERFYDSIQPGLAMLPQYMQLFNQ